MAPAENAPIEVKFSDGREYKKCRGDHWSSAKPSPWGKVAFARHEQMTDEGKSGASGMSRPTGENVGAGAFDGPQKKPSYSMSLRGPLGPHPRVASLAPLGQFTFWQSPGTTHRNAHSGKGRTGRLPRSLRSLAMTPRWGVREGGASRSELEL